MSDDGLVVRLDYARARLVQLPPLRAAWFICVAAVRATTDASPV
jgi:hypothetical protein